MAVGKTLVCEYADLWHPDAVFGAHLFCPALCGKMRRMRVRIITLCIGLSGLLLASCAHIPKPTQEELYARDRWAAIVTEEDRQTVFDETAMHTGWSEKRKVLYQLDRFQHIWRTEDRKAREAATKQAAATHAAATRAEAARAARLASRPSTRATTRRRSLHGTTEPDSKD